MGQRKTRSAIVLLCAAASFAAIVVGIPAALVAFGVKTGAVGIGVGMVLELRNQNLAASHRLVADRIVVLGDSTVVDYPPGRSVPDNLRRLMARDAPRMTLVIPIASPGISAPEYYAFADRIVANRPDQVVVAINLATLSPRWRVQTKRMESIGWMPLHRLPDLLSRPIHAFDLTLDRILLYMGIVDLDLERIWQRYSEEQIRALHGIQRARRALHQPYPLLLPDGLPRGRLPYFAGDRNRSNRGFVEAIYGDALKGASPEHPVIQMIDGALAIFQEAGVRVVAYAIPMNVEHFERLGLETRSGTEKTIASLREVVTRRGGTFLDLHRLFPDKVFKDLGGHFLQDDGFDGALIIAERLSRELLAGSKAPNGDAAERME